MGTTRWTVDLPALRARGLAHLDWRDLFVVPGKPLETDARRAAVLAAIPDDGDRDALDRYFRQFLPVGGGPRQECVSCGATLWGDMVAALLGATFTWGIVHGEGFCRQCGYPARGLHYDVGPIKRMEAILQYHPDVLKAREEAS